MKKDFFRKIIQPFTTDIGIDLGTANSLVYVSGRGIVINEPSVVAINKKTGKILAVGEKAQKMVGKTPPNILAIRPLANGVISNFEVAEQMLKYFIEKVQRKRFVFPRPRVLVGVPVGCTPVDQKSVQDAARSAGAREVYLVEEPLAAAIGAHLPIQKALGSMVVDIGGGTTEVAIISLGGIVVKKSLLVAGDRLNKDIVDFARNKLNLLIGERTAEEIKISLGSALKQDERKEAFLRGRDLINGLPREILINDEHIRKAIEKSIKTLVKAIVDAIEEAPPELISDIIKRGIVLTGGGSLLEGIAKKIQHATQIKTIVTEDPLTAVVRGTGIILENLEAMKPLLLEP